MALTTIQARIARETLCDVFTPDGYAVTVLRSYTFSDPSAPLYGRGQCVLVNGREHSDVWFPISELEPSRDLLQFQAAPNRNF